MRRIYLAIEGKGPAFCTGQMAAFCRATREAITNIANPKIARVFSEIGWKATFGPFSFAHVGLSVINAEGLHFDQHRFGFRDWISQLLDHQAVKTLELFD